MTLKFFKCLWSIVGVDAVDEVIPNCHESGKT
jgi:hypothetical protein